MLPSHESLYAVCRNISELVEHSGNFVLDFERFCVAGMLTLI